MFARARYLLDRREYSDAAKVVKEILDCDYQSTPKTSPNLLKMARYPEIGWYYLFIGEINKSCEYLIRHMQRYKIDKTTGIWLVEATWLSGLIKKHADEIADRILKLVPSLSCERISDIEYVWSRVVLGQYVNSRLKSKLWITTPSYLFKKTYDLENNYGAKAGSLLIPTTIELQKPYILTIDKLTTNGVYREFIQSF